ncbi:MAG: phenylalanine--tRNA ligase subunit beta [Candidatus Aminicenantes bacterium]|nr:MAG: phenylalanine--tRNA ligase subunit beta [Candidatus Aminicenantes bacterium]
MIISLNWLKDYIELDLPLPQLIEKLNMIGLMVEDWEEKGSDVILDIETYANRPDTLGHLGVARELAAALELGIKEQKWPLTEIEQKTSDLADVRIWDDELCPRYSGMVIKGIQVGPSPEWLRKRIEAVGLKPINNVVDVTNYVLFATAHPIHAFDLAKISGRKIIIRKATDAEVLRGLEDSDISLTPEMLVIADEKKPIALAGIIGGEESSVTESTQDVFIESACFDPVSIRKTSKKTGISTDASYRFERGADISFPPQAALMAASLLTQLGGKASKGIADVYPKPRKEKTVVLRHHRISDLLGLEIDEEFAVRTLASLGFQAEVQQRGVWQVKIPQFRVDVEREADLIEEIARFYGYDKIPASLPPLRVLELPVDQKRERINKFRQLLFHNGFDEVLNFSFSDPEKEARLQTGQKAIEIRNPVSSKASLLRTTLLGGLLENIVWNKNRGAEGIHLFEIGNVYFWQNETNREQLTLALATTGQVGPVQWHRKSEDTDFFRIKGALESLMTYSRYEPFSFKEEDHAFFEQEYSLAMIFKEETVGYCGLLKKNLLDSYSLKEPVWAAELNLALLFKKQPYSFEFTPVDRFPSITRDVSFISSRSVLYQDIKEVVEKLAIPYLMEFDPHDRFSGSSIPNGKISLSLRFVFRHPQRTLLAKEVDALQEKIINALVTKFKFQLRKGGKIDKRIRKD